MVLLCPSAFQTHVLPLVTESMDDIVHISMDRTWLHSNRNVVKNVNEWRFQFLRRYGKRGCHVGLARHRGDRNSEPEVEVEP